MWGAGFRSWAAAALLIASGLILAPVAAAGTVSIVSQQNQVIADADAVASGAGTCAQPYTPNDDRKVETTNTVGHYTKSFTVSDAESIGTCGGASSSANGSVNTTHDVALTDGTLSMSATISGSGHSQKSEPEVTDPFNFVAADADFETRAFLRLTIAVADSPVTLSCNKSASDERDANDGAGAYAYLIVGGAEISSSSAQVELPPGHHNLEMSIAALGHTNAMHVMSNDAAASLNASCTTASDTAVAITSGPSGPTGSTSATFEFIALSANPPPGRFECRIDGGTLTPCTSPVSFSGLSQGEHTFEVLYHPDGGAPGPAVPRTWTVDTVAPTVVFDAAPAGDANGAEATISFHASEEGTTFLCSLDSGIPGGCTSPARLVALAAGPHTFTVMARDAAGNEGPTETVTWTVAPTSTLPPVADCTAGGSARAEAGPFVLVARERPDACFTEQTIDGRRVQASTGPATWNGLLIRPLGGSRITLGRDGTDAVVRITGAAAIDLGPAGTWSLPSRLSISGSLTGTATRVFELLDALQEEPEDTAFAIGDLPLAISPTFEMSSDDGGKTSIGIKIALPTKVLATHEFLPSLGGEPDRTQGLSAEFTGTASNDDGFSFAGKATIAEAWLLGLLKLEDLSIGFDSGGPAFEAAGSVSFGRAVTDNRRRKATLELALGPDGFFGFLRKLSLGVSNLNVPIGTTPFYLQEVAGAGERDEDGVKISGKLGISGGPQIPVLGEALSLKGTLSLKLPERATWSLEGRGEAKIAEVPVAESTYRYIHGERVTFAGKLDLSIAGYGALAEIRDAWFTTTDFNVEGSGTLSLPILGTGNAEAVVSKTGYVVCFGEGDDRLGIGKRWGQEPQLFGNLCDLGPFRRTASAAQTQRSFAIPAGRDLFAIEIRGPAGIAPAVTLTGPGIALSAPTRSAAALLVPDAERGTTTIVLRRPRAGTYVLAAAGSVRTAIERPPVAVRARVTGRGASRTLNWSLRPQPGQRVTFVERGPAGAKVLGTTTRRRGRIRFSPNPAAGAARRTIEARVTQEGLPRESLTVARYRFVTRLRRITGIRRSSTQVRWRGQPSATGYTVVVEGPKRSVTTTTVRRPRLALARALRRSRLRLTIYPLDGFGRPGRRTAVTLAAPRRR